MSVVSLLGVNVINNPAKFTDKYEFEITFECLEPLQKGAFSSPVHPVHHRLLNINTNPSPRPDLEWKLTYVGSAQSDNYDQELDSLLVGPIPVGINKFVFEADPPDTKRIPIDELLGVTVVLLTCAYDGREFVRVGYYVNNEYETEELRNDPPAKPALEKIRRNVLANKPRVTRFAIKWYVHGIDFLGCGRVSSENQLITAFLCLQGFGSFRSGRVSPRATGSGPCRGRGGVRCRGACRRGGGARCR